MPHVLANAAAAAKAPAPIVLVVDATESPRRIWHSRVTIPVDKSGDLVLHHPRWLPGAHAPVIPVVNLAGITIRAAGRLLRWQRDPLEMSSFHVDVPAGASAIDVDLDYLVAPVVSQPATTALATEQLAVIDWAFVLVYPEGAAIDQLMVSARLKVPAGWSHAGALAEARGARGQKAGAVAAEVLFEPVALATLIDSPVLIGAFLRRFALGTAGGAAHEVDVAADSSEALEAPPETVAKWQRLPAEGIALFGARHYRAYHFLYALSNQLPRPGGLEHHESSDNRAPERVLVDEMLQRRAAGLLPHEYVHSWNGKYRRPAGLVTADYHQPMRDDLLWVYEGLTSYLGEVLTARAGLRTPELARDALALTASDMEYRAGRAWRPLQDTATAAPASAGPEEWASWRRGLDYYPEGVLLWLEVDTTLRQLSGGRVSIDDFARRFLGGTSGAPSVVPYSFDDVVSALEGLAHHDWRALLRARLDETGAHAPLGGLAAGGWRLVWSDGDNESQKAMEHTGHTIILRPSLGLTLKEDGTIVDVIPELPAARAGAAPGMKVRAVNGRRFSPEVLKEALRATMATGAIDLLVENDEWFRTLKVKYKGGARNPHLERIANTPDLLSAIFAAKSK